jgi:glycosyltransferase involved in cell wall biosynthesis
MSPAPRRRVAILATWYPTASRPGSGVFVREQARALAAVADVVVIYPDPDGDRPRRAAWTIEDAIEDGLRTIRIHVARPRIPGVRILLFAVAVRSALRRLAREDWIPDVLHAHVVFAATFALPARRRRMPLVVTEHYSGFALGTVTGFHLWLARFTFARADLVCPVSENLAGHLRRLGVKARMVVMPNAIDTRRFHPGPERRHGGPVRALLVAGLTEVKQVPVLLDALALARSRPGAPEILLDVAGDGPLLEELRQRADALGLGAAVRWLGRRNGAEVADLMRESDLVVLSSRWENLPVVLLEAMASGLPVVAPAVGGVREIVDDDSGAVVPSGDVRALADALIGVASRLPAYDPAALQARAVERYGFEAVRNRWLRVYDELIAARA